MKQKLKIAILNNNDLYRAIFHPQHIKSSRNNSIWYCLEKTPSLYSNLVTACRDWQPDEIFKAIETHSKKENWGEWSIKDSFGVLDLSADGFIKLFDAHWLYLEGKHFTPAKISTNLFYKTVDSEDELSHWRMAWDSDELLGKEIFHAKLLDDANVRIVAGYAGEKIVNGCFINKTANVLGVSNFFAPDKSIEYWSDMISFIFESIEFADVVGYERETLPVNLQALGFEAIGDLTVWLKSNISTGANSRT